MGRIIALVMLTQIATNGWWYCATMQESIGQTPLIIVPAISSLGLCLWCIKFVIEEW